MSGTQKPHFAVDLNEIERQLAQAQSGAPSPSSGGRHDPLADLARIGGQSDPFASLLSNEPQRGRLQPEHDELFAVRGEPAHDPYAHHRQPSVRTFEDEFRQEVEQPVEPQDYRQPASAGPDGYDQAAYPQTGYTQGYYDDRAEPQDAAYENVAYQRQPSRGRSRKGILGFGVLVGVLAVGSAGAFMFGGESTSVSTSEPPLIKAANEPVKVAPQNPGGVEIPNQNKQIYERAHSGETKVVTNSEQPVDVTQTVRMNGGTVSATGSASAQPPANGLNLGEPRKVRTISIKPGETAPTQSAEARSPVPAMPAMTMPAATPTAAAAPVSAAPVAKPAPVAAAAPAAPAAAPPVARPAPVAAAQTPAAPQRVASVQPTAPAAAEPASEAAIGGFSVQLAVRGTEKDAQTAFSQFQKKYPELAGQAPLIRKAEVNGNTIFRVRAGPMSRDDASSLCSSVQGQGGQCFVAKN